MGDLTIKRTLAAMVMADVVGYSRLMGADEAGTLRGVKDCQTDCIEPMVRLYRGRIIDAVGDCIFLEFASILDAAQCAISLQQSIAGRNAALPEDKRIIYRMGVNIGDVIIRDHSLFGDSVNIAARLQTLAEPGGICLSGAAFEQIREKIDADFASLGSREVKNIARPIEVFALSPAAIARVRTQAPPASAATASRWLALAAGAACLVVLAGLLGVYWWKHAGRQEFVSKLDAVLTASQANLGERSRSKLIDQYLAIGQHRAIAIAPRAQNHWWTGDWPTAAMAEEKALERCEIRFGEPCELVATDEAMAPRPAGEGSAARETPKVQYSGEFDPAQIPGVRQIVGERADVAGYLAAPEPKAAAIHPRGIFTTVSGAPTQRRAEIQALKNCNDESTKEGDGDCFLYAVGNKVVLPMRKTSSMTRP